MSVGHRYGVAAGCALQPIVFWIVFGYQTSDLVAWSPWLWMAAPVTAWMTAETAGRVWRRVRWLGQLLLAAGLCSAGVWWWWMHGLFGWGGATTTASLAIPTVVVLVFLGTAVFSGRSLARPSATTRATAADEGEFLAR